MSELALWLLIYGVCDVRGIIFFTHGWPLIVPVDRCPCRCPSVGEENPDNFDLGLFGQLTVDSYDVRKVGSGWSRERMDADNYKVPIIIIKWVIQPMLSESFNTSFYYIMIIAYFPANLFKQQQQHMHKRLAVFIFGNSIKHQTHIATRSCRKKPCTGRAISPKWNMNDKSPWMSLQERLYWFSLSHICTG